MRRFLLASVVTFALAVGIGIGLGPSEAASAGPDCYVKCKNGIEYVCCPRQWPECVTDGSPCSF
jgi:hypothetical protein